MLQSKPGKNRLSQPFLLNEIITDVHRRFAAAMAKYCRGALIQVDDSSTSRIPSLEEMVLTRRESAGVSPLYHLVEYAHDLRVPMEAFEDPIIEELEVLGMDLVSM
jgi:hypothetical protein